MFNSLLFLLIFPILCWAETVSVIVPCCYKHFHLVPELLEAISIQTKLPDEVVISISESEKIPVDQIKKTENLQYPFKVRLIFHKERLYAGENRNSACENAIGDIFISQDADDIPHPQRIEIVTNFFKLYPNIQQIIHKWTANPAMNRNFFTLDKIERYLVTNWSYYSTFTGVHNGNCAIRRQVFDKIQWTNKQKAQDVEFNKKVIEYFAQTMVIDARLLVYRNNLSSWRKTCAKN